MQAWNSHCEVRSYKKKKHKKIKDKEIYLERTYSF